VTDLLLHPDTEARLRQFFAKPGHALVIVAPKGAGMGCLL
jgi:hypothetical protein